MVTSCVSIYVEDLPLRALLKWSVIKVFVLFLEETTVAGGRFSGTMVTSCVSIYVEDF